MWLEGLKGGIFLPFPYKVSEVPRNKGHWSFILLFMEAMENTLNESETLSSLQKEDRCGKDFLKVSKKATVYKAKLLTHPHIDGQLVKERLEESEIPSKPKWPLRTSYSTGIDNTERKINFGNLHCSSVLKEIFFIYLFIYYVYNILSVCMTVGQKDGARPH